jgi:hypothetical protein
MASLSGWKISFPCRGASHGDQRRTRANQCEKDDGFPSLLLEYPDVCPDAGFTGLVRDQSKVCGVSLCSFCICRYGGRSVI